jgi:hypothetical protein
MDKFTMNLQLFGDEGENIEDNANLDNTGDIDTQNVDKDGDIQPEVDVDPEQQSKDKDNPANHAFAEMRRKNKELEMKLQQNEQKQKQVDEYYAGLAKAKGRNDITTAEAYFKAVRAEELSAQYQETNDPLKLVELLKESVFSDPRFAQPAQTFDTDSVLNKEVEDFNKEFKQNLNSYEDIPTLPNSDKVIQYMYDKDLSLKEAYTLANPDKIQAAARQAAINQAKGLTHIKANSNAGNVDSTVVTKADVDQWKQWFPNKTDEQCRKEIAANKKLFE